MTTELRDSHAWCEVCKAPPAAPCYDWCKLAAAAIPLEAIGRVLDEVMSAAVRNGANSVSMPDHYVEIAAWLARHPPQPVARELTGVEAEKAWAAATMPGEL